MAKDKKYRDVSSYYSTGSEAYKLDPIEIEESKNAKPKVKVYKKNEKLVHSLFFICAIALIFAGCLAIMIPHTMIVEQTAKNNELRDELATLKGENISLEADIANKVNLEYVETEATTRLGMNEPQAYQISYIDVPKESYTVQYSVEEETEEKGFAFAGLGGLFKKD